MKKDMLNEINAIRGMMGLSEQKMDDSPIKLQIFSTGEEKDEQGAPVEVNSKVPSFFIEVDREPVKIDNKQVEFSYVVRGRSNKMVGVYFPSENKYEVMLDTCDLLQRDASFTPFAEVNGEKCGPKYFKLSDKGGRLMNDCFGVDGYASNDGGDTSNMA